MAKRKCRDCPACTRSLLARAAMASMGVQAVAATARPVMKTCPQCGHALARHERRKDESFID